MGGVLGASRGVDWGVGREKKGRGLKRIITLTTKSRVKAIEKKKVERQRRRMRNWAMREGRWLVAKKKNRIYM
jgi:hypothetical protein